MRDWLTDAIFASVMAGFLCLWATTGVSPLVWMAWVCLHLETIRSQILRTAANAIRHFRESYPKTRLDATGQMAMLMLASHPDDARYGREPEREPEFEEVQL